MGGVGQRQNRTVGSGATGAESTEQSRGAEDEPAIRRVLWDAVRNHGAASCGKLRRLPGAPALQWRDRRRLAKKVRGAEISTARPKTNGAGSIVS